MIESMRKYRDIITDPGSFKTYFDLGIGSKSTKEYNDPLYVDQSRKDCEYVFSHKNPPRFTRF